MLHNYIHIQIYPRRAIPNLACREFSSGSEPKDEHRLTLVLALTSLSYISNPVITLVVFSHTRHNEARHELTAKRDKQKWIEWVGEGRGGGGGG